MERERLSVVENLKARRSQRLSARSFAAESLQSAADQISILQQEVESLSEDAYNNDEAAVSSRCEADQLRQESRHDKAEIDTLQDLLLESKSQLLFETRLERETARDLAEEAEQARKAKDQTACESSWSRTEVQSVMTTMNHKAIQVRKEEAAELKALKLQMDRVRKEEAEEIKSLNCNLGEVTSLVRTEEDTVVQSTFAEQRLAEEMQFLLGEVAWANNNATASRDEVASVKKEAASEVLQVARAEAEFREACKTDLQTARKEMALELEVVNQSHEQTQREVTDLRNELVTAKQRAYEEVKNKERVARHEMRESAMVSQQQVRELQEMAEELSVCMPMLGELGARDLEIGELKAELEARSQVLEDSLETSSTIVKLRADLERATAEVNDARIERENFDRERGQLGATITQLTAELERRSIAQAQPMTSSPPSEKLKLLKDRISDRRSSAPVVGFEASKPEEQITFKARDALGAKMSKLQAERAELLKLIGGVNGGNGGTGYPSPS